MSIMQHGDLEGLINELRKIGLRLHYISDDCWYSCPASGECCNEDAGEVCNCGADFNNKKVEEVYNKIINKLEEE